MDFWGTVLVLLRRWYIVMPTFALSVAAAAGVYSTIPTTYISSAVLILTTPTTGGSLPSNPDIPNGLTNPMLNFDRGLNVSASILITVMGTPDMAVELGAVAGGDTSFKVTNGSDNPEALATGPFLFIEGESPTADGARDIVTKVIARAKRELFQRQQAVRAPRATYITTFEAVPPTTPEAQRGKKLRAVAAAVGLGAVASLCAAFMAESFARARRARRRADALERADALDRADAGEAKKASPAPAALNGRLPADGPAVRR
ncbi:hypothetical protein ACQPYK_03870 [Streptosporangium sp. CA-135522]|uniref:hypothetical protein n=1 Tax=Streptosporangium sp. CA-135522 TaxID=3240072 RepID=UPI003D8DB109